jgi:AcrR family transcriptional regulator
VARRAFEPGVDRRQHILEAALDVFAEVGFDAATTKEIARRAGVTPGLIYFYFPNKEGLFSAAFDHQATTQFERLGLHDEDLDEPPEVVVPRLMARFIEVMSVPRCISVLRLMTRAAISEDEHGERGIKGRIQFQSLGQRITENLRDYLDGQVRRGALRPLDTALAAHLITGAVAMLMIRRARGDEPLTEFSPEALSASVADVFLRGLVVSPGHAGETLAPDIASAGPEDDDGAWAIRA